jgi:hypothetical protein
MTNLLVGWLHRSFQMVMHNINGAPRRARTDRSYMAAVGVGGLLAAIYAIGFALVGAMF